MTMPLLCLYSTDMKMSRN